MSEALDVLSGLVLEDGRAWADAATPVQFRDAKAVLDGDQPYHFLTRSRGYGKTSDMAGAAVALLLTLPQGSRLYWLASDQDQGKLAVDSIFGYAARTPLLEGALDVQRSRVTAKATGSVLDVLAADAPSSWGLRPAAVFVDEFAQWGETPAAHRLWESVSSAAVKVPGARMVVITTAGSPEHTAAKVLEHARGSELWRVSETPGPPPWLDPAKLAEQRSRLPAAVYEQLFENRWTHAEGAFLDPHALEACFELSGPTPAAEDGERYVAGLDLGHVNDRTAFAIGHRSGEAVYLDRLEVWQGSPKAPVSFAQVEDVIYAAWKRFHFRLNADPWQGLHLLERLRDRGVYAKERTFSPAFKQKLASTLLQAVNDRALRLFPDEELRDELLALRVKQTSSGWSFDHASTGHDDRATALALVTVAALEQGGAGSYFVKPRAVGGPIDPERQAVRTFERWERDRRKGRRDGGEPIRTV